MRGHWFIPRNYEKVGAGVGEKEGIGPYGLDGNKLIKGKGQRGASPDVQGGRARLGHTKSRNPKTNSKSHRSQQFNGGGGICI